jgi:hypoxanthine phosphoribosyltransferase|tara:strand:+ start:681 stop:1121 length:441 start_codon:yes stop_codon:yes gene_type:complete
MNNPNKKYLSVDQINDAIIEINKKLILSKWSPDVIISLNRGGCVPGVYLSHLINVPHEVIDLKKTDKSQYLNSIEKYKNILIVDDINDTGKTLQLTKSLFSNSIAVIKYGVLVNNESSDFIVNYAAIDINKKVDDSWIVFPWEEMK